ncbi:hypothetical protein N9B82_04510 [Saprospiraceae bacterium]|nr:hypothetical protein [Saprospiraceae bacterium]
MKITPQYLLAPNALLVALVFMLFVSCEPPVVFDSPYPLGVENLEEIPTDFHGVYMCESDSSLIWISDQTIIHESYHYFQTSLERVRETDQCSIVDEMMILPGNNECIPLTYITDSIVRGEYIVSDTLFKNKKYAVARMYKGHLVINTKIEQNEWMIHYLSPDDGNLYYRSIVDKSNLKQIARITEMEDITEANSKQDRFLIKPSMKEFDALFHNEKIFIECEYLISVEMEIPPNCAYPLKSGTVLQFNKY